MMTDVNVIPCETTSFVVADIKTLILLLHSPETSIAVGAIESLTKYADICILHCIHEISQKLAQKNRIQLLSLRITKPLIDLALSKEGSIKKAAVACLAAVTELSEIHPDLRKRELIEVLISSLNPEEASEVQDEAAFAMANLAKDFANKADIRKLGGIRALIRVLESPDPDVKKNAGLALSILLEDFANRSEIRFINGMGAILDLLNAEYIEIQENALNSLLRCAEDHGNRIEIRKQNGLKKMVDLLAQEGNVLHARILECISLCLEDNESTNIFPDTGGFPILIKLAASDEIKIKKMVGIVLNKLARVDRNTNYLREAGVLQVLLTNLSHYDPIVVTSSAFALANVAKNEINQIELNKMGIIDLLAKLLAHDDLSVKSESVTVISSLFPNGKIRNKIRNTPEIIQGIIKLLQSEDEKSIINASECVSVLAEEAPNRTDFIKNNCVTSLLSAIEKSNPTLQSMACLALARCLQDQEAQVLISKVPSNRGILRLIELIGSKEVAVCRHASYSLSNACQLDINAISACNAKALEALIALARDPTKNTSKFAAEATDKILNCHLSAKYWLRNTLAHDNILNDGFYDLGSANPSLEAVINFPPLSELQKEAPNKKREVILIDWINDALLQTIFTEATENLGSKGPQAQLKHIARTVVKYMGGPVDKNQITDFSYKFHISELKLKLNSNIIPIGQISQGTFYHRALLFKAICDRIGLAPCTLIRGDYNRAWNVVDTRKQSLVVRQIIQKEQSATVPNKESNAYQKKGSLKPKITPSTPPSKSLTSHSSFLQSSAGAGSLSNTQGAPVPVPLEEEEEIPALDDTAIIDLMFEPGSILLLGTPAANAYQRM